MADYNPIFETLVIETEEDSADRLTGILAYGLYKLNKYDYYKYFQDTKGRKPNEAEEECFLATYNDPRLQELRDNANNRIYGFANAFLEEQVEDIKKAAIESGVAKTVEEFEKRHRSIWMGVWMSALGALLYTFLTAIIIFGVTVFNPDSDVAKFVRAFINDQEIVIQPKVPQLKNPK